MSDFVEQCRVAWSRLGVSDSFAEEMAQDLASDLSEAEAEGVSPEELLGESLFDPRAFAASWAAERGIIPPSGRNGRHRPMALSAFTVLAGVALVVSALLLLTGEPKVSLVKSRTGLHLAASPAQGQETARVVVNAASASAPVEWILLFLAATALVFAAWLWSNRRSKTSVAAAS